ncbi:MAG: hypothetical protein ABFC67_03545 [Mizugakiibacter sp.]|uniref:hypothetical protein n=1 Tax=Mizugakiibacter sp. TaxID=1972610 RepID=UPI0031C1AB35|nr:hypothetical protein [Xanthomonadaceae bacterium]
MRASSWPRLDGSAIGGVAHLHQHVGMRGDLAVPLGDVAHGAVVVLRVAADAADGQVAGGQPGARASASAAADSGPPGPARAMPRPPRPSIAIASA